MVFLGLDEILDVHRDQIRRYGGLSGVRDLGLLQSAISMPSSMFEGTYLHQSLSEMAAAYLFHIVKNHPFYDGNKRTGAVAAIVFLEMNGAELQTDEEALEKLIRDVAEGKADKRAVASFLEQNARGCFQK
ncbi:MAG: type II toxin-antitoxin system death-on-curing family toxin [Desulfomonile tiedjei]|nr:type II toxin-antitoxin system death-on-curing family toxin [Desulfomonile tiedjei]